MFVKFSVGDKKKKERTKEETKKVMKKSDVLRKEWEKERRLKVNIIYVHN